MKKFSKPFIALLCASSIFLTSGCAEGANNAGASITLNSDSGSISSENSAGAPQNSIDLKAAIAAALNHAGLTESQVTLVKTKLDHDNGIAEYDIEFTANSTRYEYEIKAADGSILEFSAEKIPIVNPQAPSGGGSNGNNTAPSYITEAQARDAALKHAGFTESQVVFIKTKLDYDSGVVEYDIEFTANSTRYEYEIKAADGTVLEYSSEAVSTPDKPAQGTSSSEPTPTSPSDISVDEAKSIALKHAGVSESAAVFIKAKLEHDDGASEYDIEFTANSTRYEYEIRASDGKILEFSAEPIAITPPQPSEASISKEEAKNIALKHAGVSASEAVFIKVKHEHDDGISIYDIEFTANSVRYEFEIRASDGAVLEFSSEPLPSAGGNQGGTNLISLISEEEAKSIALKHIGFSAGQVTFIEVKLDHDDGAAEYEVEFRVGNVKYEIKINASNGWVIEVEIDDDDD